MTAWAATHASRGCGLIPVEQRAVASDTRDLIPPERTRYLAEIVRTLHDYKARAYAQAERARELQALRTAKQLLSGESGVDPAAIERAIERADARLDADARRALIEGAAPARGLCRGGVRHQDSRERGPLSDARHHALRTRQPRVAVPQDDEPGALVRFAMLEHLPGNFPFTAAWRKREGEDPKRMFAGEGGPARTNERFHYLRRGSRRSGCRPPLIW